MNLYSPLTVGDIELANRVVMAPLTRMRSRADGVPSDLNVEHYAQRAGLGLIITEGVFPSPESKAYPGQPGIATDEQAAGWARVADAVHAAGGRIVMQVMHGGRVSHPRHHRGRSASSLRAPSRSTAMSGPPRASAPSPSRTH